MDKILFAWIGKTDLNAANNKGKDGLGPIAQAVSVRSFSRIFLLCNYPKKDAAPYLDWIKSRTNSKVSITHVSLSSPTNHGEIYEAAEKAVRSVKQKNSKANLTFHLSPGTPSMAAIWIIIGKTKFPAELIEASKERGVLTASIPFDISADFIPDMLRGPDEIIEQLTEGLPPEAPEYSDIIYRGPKMKKVIDKARRVAVRSIPVLIEGESGTGKELLARAIHSSGTLKNKPFVAVNCGAISSDIVDSELFGHVKGAFTGAERERKGYFEAANGGTIFLDEIGELSKSTQVKLLRVLQEKEVVRVGSTEPIRIDVRIIAATNRTLINEVTQGGFREDLFYRLAVAVIKLPSLRDRSGDLSLLVDRLIEQVDRESATEPGYETKKLSAGAKNALLQHNWPGNVRELLNTLRRAAVWSGKVTISKDDIEDAILPMTPVSQSSDDILNRPIGKGVNLQGILSDVAKHYMERTLKETGGNKSRAAKLLGFTHYQTFSNWAAKYNLK